MWPFTRKTPTERFPLPAAPVDTPEERRQELVEAGQRLKEAEVLRDRYSRRIAESYVAGGLAS